MIVESKAFPHISPHISRMDNPTQEEHDFNVISGIILTLDEVNRK